VEHTGTEPVISLFQAVLLFIPQRTIFIPLIVLLNIIATTIRKIMKNRGPKLHLVHFIVAKPLKRADIAYREKKG
jgi:hypothetical protein